MKQWEADVARAGQEVLHEFRIRDYNEMMRKEVISLLVSNTGIIKGGYRYVRGNLMQKYEKGDRWMSPSEYKEIYL